MNTQISMVSVEDLMPKNHAYRKFKELINFKKIYSMVSGMAKETGRMGFGKEFLTLCIILQFLEDLFDKELERFVQENNTAKWFLDIDLTAKTPDHSTFCKFRNALGTKRMGQIFDEINRQLRKKEYLKTCSLLWTQRLLQAN